MLLTLAALRNIGFNRAMGSVSVAGAELAYWQTGDGPPVLFIHGSGTSGELWREALADLATDHQVITYNRRGYPGSPGTASHWRDHGDDAAALIEALDVAPAAVIGYSGGAVAALDLALRRPELVSTLVLLDPAVHTSKNMTPGLARAFTKLKLLDRFGRRDRALDSWYSFVTSYSTGGSTWERMPEERKRLVRATGDGMLGDLGMRDHTHVAYERLGEIEAPVTIIECELSPSFLRKSCRALAEAMPKADVVTLEGVNHVAFADHPERLNEALRAATSRVRAA